MDDVNKSYNLYKILNLNTKTLCHGGLSMLHQIETDAFVKSDNNCNFILIQTALSITHNVACGTFLFSQIHKEQGQGK